MTPKRSDPDTALLILGNQLFDPKLIEKNLPEGVKPVVFLREDRELCTYFKFHKHKIILFLAAMRTYAEELKRQGFEVVYEELEKSQKPYEKHFLEFLKSRKIKSVFSFEIEDQFLESRISKALQAEAIDHRLWESPMFLTSREEFRSYLKTTRKPFMKTFYERQRKRLDLLVDRQKKPLGGQWSFDAENRKPLPPKIHPPSLPKPKPSKIVRAVQALTETQFPDHPGDAEAFWLPVSRAEARDWLDSFLDDRLAEFGPYEDALAPHSDFVFHSVLTPVLNLGLLTPHEVMDGVREKSRKTNIPLPSVEGFVRQVIGWREFIRGIYQNFSKTQDSRNFFGHRRHLTRHWYEGSTGIPPLDATIQKAMRTGYAHHIERLMVVGSLMLLLEVDPREAYRWFMEMFVDSSDWVMGPNVFGMALFSDGGIFATKPYFCGSNYYCKMGGYKKGEWCDKIDGLYWQFIEKHREFFLKNPRLSMMVRTVEKMDPARKRKIFAAAEELRSTITRRGESK